WGGAVAAPGGRAQADGEGGGDRRGMARYLHTHGGEPGDQVLGRDPKLFGEFVDARGAQPVLTSSCSLDRGRSRPEPSWVVPSAGLAAPAASRRALRAASTPGAPAAFNARCTLRRLAACTVQTGFPHR